MERTSEQRDTIPPADYNGGYTGLAIMHPVNPDNAEEKYAATAGN